LGAGIVEQFSKKDLEKSLSKTELPLHQALGMGEVLPVETYLASNNENAPDLDPN
jgi:hypothetical protein